MTQAQEATPNAAPAPPRGPHEPGFSRKFLHPRYLGTWLLVALLRATCWLPNGARHWLGGAVGDLFRRTNEKRRRIAEVNIGACFPELSAPERDALVVEHFRSYGRGVVDFGLMWWGPKRRLDAMTEFNGLEHVLEPIAQGTPVLVFTPHSPGLDFGGIMLSSHVETTSMMKSLRNPIQDWLITSGRRRFGADVFLRDSGLRPLLRALRAGRVCFYMPDEDFGSKSSMFVPFFGVEAATLTTLGRMARATDAVVVPCFSRILPAGRGYVVDFEPPLKNFPSGDDYKDAVAMNAALETGIRRMPAQYMWTLRWFKTRPPGQAPFYD